MRFMNYKVGGDSGKSMTKLALRTDNGGNIRVQLATTCEESETKAKSDLKEVKKYTIYI